MKFKSLIKKLEYKQSIRSQARWLRREVWRLEITPDEAVHELASWKSYLKRTKYEKYDTRYWD